MSAPICNTAWFQEGGRQVRARMVQEGKLCSHLYVLYQHLRICFFWGGPKYSRGWGDFSPVWVGSPAQGIHDMVRGEWAGFKEMPDIAFPTCWPDMDAEIGTPEPLSIKVSNQTNIKN